MAPSQLTAEDGLARDADAASVGAAEAAANGGGFVSQSIALLLGGGFAALLSMIYSSLCARWLTPVRFADLVVALSLSFFLLAPIWPIEAVLTQSAADAHGARDRARMRAAMARATRLALKFASLGFGGWLLITPLARIWLAIESRTLLVLLGVYVAGAYLLCVPRGVMRGDHRFAAYALNQVIEGAVRIAAGAALMALGFGTDGALAGYAAAMFVAFAVGGYQLRDLSRVEEQRRETAAIERPAGAHVAYHLYALFCTNADLIVAKQMLSAHDAGLYAAATTLSRMLYVLATPVYQVLLSRVVALHAARQATRPIAGRGLAALFAMVAVSCVVPFGFGGLCIQLLFGDAFAGALAPLRILWLSASLICMQTAFAYVLIGSGRAKAFWTLIGPCAILCVLFVGYHATLEQVAFASLAGASIGALWICGLGWASTIGSKPSVVPK